MFNGINHKGGKCHKIKHKVGYITGVVSVICPKIYVYI